MDGKLFRIDPQATEAKLTKQSPIQYLTDFRIQNEMTMHQKCYSVVALFLPFQKFVTKLRCRISGSSSEEMIVF